MSLPTTLAVLACIPLLASPALAAPPQSAPKVAAEPRRVTLPPVGGRMPEVRVAKGGRTFLVFDTPLTPDSVRLEGDGTRVRLVDVGGRMLALEPLVDLGEEGAILRVGFADGKAPEVASLALVTHPTEIDKEVEVRRGAQSVEELQGMLTALQLQHEAQGAELAALQARCKVQGARLAALQDRAEAGDLVGLALSGVLHDQLMFRRISASQRGSGAIVLDEGWLMVTSGRWVLGVSIENRADWPLALRGAEVIAIYPENGSTERTRAIPLRMERTRIAPGERGRLAVEGTGIPPATGSVLSLHPVGAGADEWIIFTIILH